MTNMTKSNSQTGRLVLSDGTIFKGIAFGKTGPGAHCSGEVVFNTAMCGYQESLTDPSYTGQILCMTAPMIGNYGVNDADTESTAPCVAGFVIRENARIASNHRATDKLDRWLDKNGITAIAEIDTRALVRHIRAAGAMPGVICADDQLSDEELLEIAQKQTSMSGCNLASGVSVNQIQQHKGDLGPGKHRRLQAKTNQQFTVAAIDCGGKRAIYQNLTERGCAVTLVPATTSADEIRDLKPDGLFISNGPGDPAAVDQVINLLRELAVEIPTFGICLGHQLLALALGADTFKLPFGHRGANQPVRNVLTGRIEITSQNHGFCVNPDSLDALDCDVTHWHLNDNTVAGMRHRSLPIFSVQYHPEASPGPHDAAYLFDCFTNIMSSGKPVTEEEMRQAQQQCDAVTVVH